jgi:glycosyltransferase involved in cell wall biosynthesis
VEGIEVHYPRYYYVPKIFRPQYGWFYWLSVRGRIKHLLSTFRPEVLLSYWTHPDGEAAVRAARLARVPAVVMVGGSDVLVLTANASRKRRIVQVLQNADAVVAVSHDLKSKLIGLGISPEKVHVVYRGVDRRRFAPGDRAEARRRLGLPDNKRVLVWVGRMVPVKGLDILLEACVQLRSRDVHLHLYLVGDGPLRASLRAETVAKGLAGMISFIGLVDQDQLPDWYRAADLVVLPSRSEGVPNVLREAKACGTRFVASRVGGIPELAVEPWDQLVPAGDPAALAGAIEKGLSRRDAIPCPQDSAPGWADSANSLAAILEELVKAKRH